MLDTIKPVNQEITLRVHFVGGESFTQYLSVDDAEVIQNFMDWFRRPGKDQVWAWHVVHDAEIHMMHHRHIIAVDIEGYVEPEGRPSRWYERWLDRLRMRWL
ncbi:hypothetical protein [Cohnella algarum]|uniref:hypothetical protein n=1 Tax=Cohnella algarum TaxID=2044859 RepID=UPI001968743F|nr:hypothetical protein [Cohnella algarum]MBN2980119.1 hypothetical protein [Cohnella algarum]